MITAVLESYNENNILIVNPFMAEAVMKGLMCQPI